VPTAVTGDLTFRSVSAGLAHTCGVTLAGAAYCWGSNGEGRLGDGTEIDRTSPTPVVGELTFQLVGAGALHTCGLSTESTAYCWGWNFTGSLGESPRELRSSAVPVPVTGDLRFETLEVGGNHACGRTADDTWYCWGANVFGQLGIGTLTVGSYIPVPIFGQR
jgi:hypothetical protein